MTLNTRALSRGRQQCDAGVLYKVEEYAMLHIARAFNNMVEEIPRQGRLEGCHRMSAATHLICGLESV